MNRLPPWSGIALFVVLAVAGFVFGGPGRDFTTTSFGVLPPAHGAFYDLLHELGAPVARSYEPASRLPLERPVWWIAPGSLCASKEDRSEMWAPLAWVERGGTAIVFPPDDCPLRPLAAALQVPERSRSGADSPEADVVEEFVGATDWPSRRAVTGGGLRAFDAAPGWETRAQRTQQPFAIERAVGAGRLVLVADSRFLINAELDRGDNALLAMDLVRIYGAPLIDEREHGLTASDSTVLYLLRSPAALLLLGMLLLGGVYAWAGQAMPPRQLAEADRAAPTLTSFVDSIAGLYAMSRDYRQIAAAYRQYTLAKLRRHYGLAHDVGEEALLERLRSHLQPDAWDRLRSLALPTNASELRSVAADLDRIAAQAMR